MARKHIAVAVASTIALSSAAFAYDFEVGEELTGTIITTLSVGAQLRMADRDPRNVGYYNGGEATAADADDGNLNFDKYDLITQITSVRSEMRLQWRNWFAAVSGEAFYDSIADRNNLARNGSDSRAFNGEYSPRAHDAARWGANLREYYIGGNFDVFGNNLQVKVGSQILNWGEALFTLNGISVINPLEVTKILTPGTELKDALIPVPMVKASYELPFGLSFEAFYQLDFEPTKLPPCGSFLSFNDNFCDGVYGTSVFTDWGDGRSYTVGRDNAADYNNPAPPYGTGPQALSTSVPITELDDPSAGDWGASIRYFSPDLNNTEFQFYYSNYRSRLPAVYFKATDDYATGTGQAALGNAAQGVVGTLLASVGLQGQQQILQALQAISPGFQPTGDILGSLLDPVVRPLISTLINPSVGTLPRSVVFENLDGGRFYQYYPDNLHMLGMAFSTTENTTGIAINGEISYKHNVPIFMSPPLFFSKAINSAGGIPIDQGTANARLPLAGLVTINNFGIAPIADGPAGEDFDDQYIPGRRIEATKNHDVWQAALRLTKIFGGTDLPARLSGATSVTALVEFGGLYIDLDKGYPYGSYNQNGFSGFTSRPFIMGGIEISPRLPVTTLGPPFYDTGRVPTRWSGGVQGIVMFDYPDLIDGVKLTPSIAFSHGLVGITPAPLPGFTKGMTSLLFGLKADFSQRFSVTATYFKSFGAGGGPSGARNPFIDRDFLGLAATYQF